MTPPTEPKRPAFRDREIERSLAEAARIGVAVLRKYHGRVLDIRKKGVIDFVTQADAEAEQRVLDYLARRHPSHTLIGEESWDGRKELPAGFAWVLDPLDGTTNYAHGLDHYAFSLGVTLDGESVAGIVVDPERDHVYRAFRGRGAFRGRKRLRVSNRARLADCLLATGFPYDRRKRIAELMALHGAFLKRTHGVRRMGVAALDLALTAAGQLDGYYEPVLGAWDVAAGTLLVREAGGEVSDYDGRPHHLFSGSIVCGSPPIRRAMLRVIRKTLKEIERGD